MRVGIDKKHTSFIRVFHQWKTRHGMSATFSSLANNDKTIVLQRMLIDLLQIIKRQLPPPLKMLPH